MFKGKTLMTTKRHHLLRGCRNFTIPASLPVFLSRLLDNENPSFYFSFCKQLLLPSFLEIQFLPYLLILPGKISIRPGGLQAINACIRVETRKKMF